MKLLVRIHKKYDKIISVLTCPVFSFAIVLVHLRAFVKILAMLSFMSTILPDFLLLFSFVNGYHTFVSVVVQLIFLKSNQF